MDNKWVKERGKGGGRERRRKRWDEDTEKAEKPGDLWHFGEH
jgi:hypothetical protein